MGHIGILFLFLMNLLVIYPSPPMDNMDSGSNTVSLVSKKKANITVDYSSEYSANTFKASVFHPYRFTILPQTTNQKVSAEIKSPEITTLSFIYFYVALIGFYIAAILLFNNKVDSVAKKLISSFIFIHSIFILHIFLSITKYNYQYPHTYRMSTAFSFLYGPLLYLYFRRITEQYKLRKTDILHFVPTLLFIIYLIPGYLLSADQKLEIILNRVYSRSLSSIIIIVLKSLSLLIYGHLIRKLYLSSRDNKSVGKENKRWQKNIYLIHISYVICYMCYGFLLVNTTTSGFLYHMQVVCMASMVMYLGYSANIQPDVFNGSLTFNKLFFKYEKSGLTESLSLELKENLVNLFDKEKIYKESNLSLETLAKKLNTTRHNASQVINEHFKMSFHELVNTYRIKEAKEIISSDVQKNLNIIDVAYEVGYNNKVTFNKAFKKDTQLTPSEYQRMNFGT